MDQRKLSKSNREKELENIRKQIREEREGLNRKSKLNALHNRETEKIREIKQLED
jgi:hypothetical protein